jgi:hypothetical protein
VILKSGVPTQGLPNVILLNRVQGAETFLKRYLTVIRSSAQEIPQILWKLEVRYRVNQTHHWSLLWASSIQSIPSYPIIISSKSRFLKLSLSFTFYIKTFVHISPTRTTFPLHVLDFTTPEIFEEY